MGIWFYDSSSRQPEFVWQDQCPFCNTGLSRKHSDYQKTSHGRGKRNINRHLDTCKTCGWWKALKTVEDDNRHLEAQFATRYGAAGSLRELDLSDLSTPIEEVRVFLTAKYESRFTLHPRLFEQTVASVFEKIGYRSLVTAYSGDDGIDVILEKEGERVGVQVKRHRNSVKVEQIRSLAGAMVLGQYTKGIFITTSVFQREAHRAANRYATKGYKIELIDAERFYDTLKISQANTVNKETPPIEECYSYVKQFDNYALFDRDFKNTKYMF